MKSRGLGDVYKRQVMGGVAASHVEYATYLKWVFKLLVIIAVACAIILTVAEMIF